MMLLQSRILQESGTPQELPSGTLQSSHWYFQLLKYASKMNCSSGVSGWKSIIQEVLSSICSRCSYWKAPRSRPLVLQQSGWRSQPEVGRHFEPFLTPFHDLLLVLRKLRAADFYGADKSPSFILDLLPTFLHPFAHFLVCWKQY